MSRLRFSQTDTPFADLTDVTLADEDTNLILTDNANKAIQGNMAMQIIQVIQLIQVIQVK